MEEEQIKIINDAKEILIGLEKVSLMELLFYIDELIKNYEDRHKA